MKVPEHKIKRRPGARSSLYCKPLEHSGSTCMSSALMVMFLAVTGGKQVTAEAPEKSASPTWPKETKTMAKEAVLS